MQTIGYVSCALIVVAIGCASLPDGVERRAIPVTRTSDNTNSLTTLPSSFRLVGAMQVQWDDEESRRWQSGCHRLSIYDCELNKITSRVFRSHYGMDVDAVDLDGDSIPEFVMFLHVGPAMGPPIRELKILRLKGSFLEEILQVPLAGQAGPQQGWWYKVTYVTDDSAQVTLRLALHHDPLGEWAPFLPKTRYYRILVRNREVNVQSHADGTASGNSRSAQETK